MEAIVTSHRDQAARRKQIAEEIASIPAKKRSGIIDDVALRYRVSNSTVRAACKEHHVKIPSRN
jgi:hypothetical protein